jgi:hypothetical protein
MGSQPNHNHAEQTIAEFRTRKKMLKKKAKAKKL